MNKLSWTPEQEQRFTDLRLLQLERPLVADEQKELDTFWKAIQNIDTTASAFYQLEENSNKSQHVLTDLESDNQALVELFNQQASLIKDTKRWLVDFEQRYSNLHKNKVEWRTTWQ